MSQDTKLADAGYDVQGMRFIPMHDRVLLKVKELPEKVGSLFTPEAFRERHRSPRGVVLAVGPGRVLDDGTRSKITYPVNGNEVALAPGDMVQFSQYAGQYMDDEFATEKAEEGSRLAILRDSDLHGVWVPNKDSQ